MARLSNMPPINISTEELQRWGEKWLLDRNIDAEEEALNELSQLEENMRNAQTDRKQEAIQRKIYKLDVISK